MAQISFEVPTNADAVWWMELGKKLGQKMEVVFDTGNLVGYGDFGYPPLDSPEWGGDLPKGRTPKILREHYQSIKRKNQKGRR